MALTKEYQIAHPAAAEWALLTECGRNFVITAEGREDVNRWAYHRSYSVIHTEPYKDEQQWYAILEKHRGVMLNEEEPAYAAV